MQYRNFDKIDEKVSLMGLGAMRLPSVEGNENEADEERSIKIIRDAIDSGVNYIDTAFTYHNGKSERIVGKALKDGYREKVLLADKMPIWLAKEEDDVKSLFDKQMERLDTECIDMYLVHNICVPHWKRAKKLNLMDFLEKMKAEGKIKYIGFSFHDSYEFFEEVVDAYPWDFCQIQLNYVDKNHQAGLKGLKYAASKGMGVAIMEPLKGGRIVSSLPPTVEKIWDAYPVKKSLPEWAFKWLASMPEVTVILNGISSEKQLEENLQLLSKEDILELSNDENSLIDKVSDEYNRLIKYSCTGCKYCMPCTQRLDIPKIIEYYNDWNVYEQNPNTKFEYTTWLPSGHHASDCIDCKACEEHCPQNLPITEIMKRASKSFGL
ncbi:MAG: aldo/keto reductase [Clostridiales bacterium]|nr:aldo/keto reductase [Clostridiales bacterium]